MTIVVSDNFREYPEGLTLMELIVAEKVETPQYVTVSVNDVFVDGNFDDFVLKEGDNVEFLYFMGGGVGVALLGEAKQ